jgi:flavodoxin
MKQLLIAFCLFTMCMVSGCANAQQKMNEKKILIVYLSRTNNTKAIAEIIHQQVGGKLVALELQSPYPASYQATVSQVAKENETGYLPPLKTRIDSIEQYDVAFIGFPTWGMQLPPPMKSFLHQYNFEGKTIFHLIQMQDMVSDRLSKR